MKQALVQVLIDVVEQLKTDGVLPSDAQPRLHVENTKDKSHGDFATNLAMMLTKLVGKPPRDVAQMIIERISAMNVAEIEKIEIAGPGFINFFVNDSAKFGVIETIFAQKEQFGRVNVGEGKKVLVEFVSANPTGPLHVGHGRGAAYGASVSNLLETAGFDVAREYYVNDAGRQMDILATSVWLRYLQAQGQDLTFPSNGYKGDYILDIAAEVQAEHGDVFIHDAATVFADVHPDEGQEGGDK